MLTIHKLETVRAALLFWQDELVPHGPQAMQAYLQPETVVPLSAEETTALRQQFGPSAVRYVLYEPGTEWLAGTELIASGDDATRLAVDELRVATVLLEPSSTNRMRSSKDPFP